MKALLALLALAATAVAADLNTLTDAEKQAGWRLLFDGKSLAGWTAFLPGGDPLKTWTVADGVLRCTGRPAGYIATDRSFTSFILELEWRFDPAKGAGNSGVLLRVQQPDHVWPTSMEAQLMSGSAGDIWNIGDFPMVTDAKRTSGRHTAMDGKPAEHPLGEWNRYRIVVDGPLLELYVNGELKNRATGCRVVPGRIALQSEGAWIEFRGIRLTPLPDDAPSPPGTHAPAHAKQAAPPPPAPTTAAPKAP